MNDTDTDTDTNADNLLRAQIILLPTLSALGVITNILNIITLSSRALRPYSCTQYFLALSIAQLFDSLMGPINEIFFGVFQPSNALVTALSCKLIQFFAILPPFASFGLIILASVDRFCASSASVSLRSMCKVSVAYRSIAILSLISVAYMSGFLAVMDVSYLSGSAVCIESTKSSAQIYVLCVMLTITIVVPVLMLLFGLLTIYHIRKQQRRVGAPTNQNRRTDTELAVMLIAQISAVIVFTGPFCIVFLMSTFMSEEQAASSSLDMATAITDLWQTISDSASFFLYTLTASLYRQELIKIFRKCYNRLRQR